jgi:hypothetical protein
LRLVTKRKVSRHGLTSKLHVHQRYKISVYMYLLLSMSYRVMVLTCVQHLSILVDEVGHGEATHKGYSGNDEVSV